MRFSGIVLVQALLMEGVMVAQTAANWVQQHPPASPSPRHDFAMAYDAGRGQIVLFGGAVPGSAILGDTWVWDGSNWTQKSPQRSPPARWAAAMAYDAPRGQIVLFSGLGPFGGPDLVDTWVWDGSNWTQKSPSASPSSRSYFAMASDSARGHVVLFGGNNVVDSYNDTWTWDGSNWTQRSPHTIPSKRSRHRMVYDSARRQIVMFGGSTQTLDDETWIWDGTDWTQKFPATRPPTRVGNDMAYDAAHGQIVLFGGSGHPVNDTWIWDGSNWTLQTPVNSPPARSDHGMVYDFNRAQIVLFGGLCMQCPSSGLEFTVPLGDTWVWNTGAPRAATLKLVSGDGQNGVAGSMLANPIVVALTDTNSNPFAGATVTFTGTNATATSANVQTDIMGRASTGIALGATGGAAKVTATVGGLASVTFNFTVIPAATTLTIQKTWQAANGGNPRRGDDFTYTIKVGNGGTAPATAVNVQDVPAGQGELVLGGPLTFNLGTLAPGASQTMTVAASASAAGSYLNTAKVSWSDTTGTLSTASTSATTTVDPQPGDFASIASAVKLNTGVRQAYARGTTVYVVNNPGDSVTILDCTGGACTISRTVMLGAGASPVMVTTMDVDKDGQDDVLILNQGTGTIATLLSSNPAQTQVSNVGAGAVTFAPFQAGDGIARVAVAFSGAVAVFAWDGSRFQPASAAQTTAAPAFALLNGDFNGDGVDDLLVGLSGGAVQLWAGDGTGAFRAAGDLDVGGSVVALTAGDVNNDGALDAVAVTQAGMIPLLNDGAGNLTPQPAVPAQGGAAVLLADFDGDGNLDAAVANTGGSSVSLFRGDGAGNFMPAGSYLTGKAPAWLAATDLDGNGTADLISANRETQDLTVLLFK